ncbi:type I-MYXAN CRISPR-associated protein Cas6/Cmx6 [Chromatium okenii]|uniref:type I-MYXAN CRISPR-associated protein Cas6/Cmx6 n=1 Tax=Chromatium okenii TaxID=61644 RepID=UPI0026EFEF98|nr:type I-MYXAN CRISPR-associated protein Cas6/Cmx6 [Chromatium okenii]MBV5309452.1 type I-MYXAN CRISPR-associated protein Cas6/Cmx6 [Chromatium okenii]
MFWHEDKNPDEVQIPDDIVDLLFTIDCKSIPVDHAHLLSTALQAALSWLATESQIGLHTIHVAGSQNGWQRPAHGGETELLLSRRTKLIIRAPKWRVADLLQQLPGVTLDLAGHALTIGAGKIKLLTKDATLFSRYVVTGNTTADNADEQEFLATAAGSLAAMGIHIRKALCGKATALATPQGLLHTRSLLLAALTAEESIQLQQHGLGTHRLLGCGIFIPHKGIDSVKNG